MPEAVKEVIRYLFEDVELDVIFCGHFLWNHQSGRVQEKCGFRHYAYGQFETRLGTIEDDEVNILTKEQWQRNMLDELGLDEDVIVNAKMDQNEAKSRREGER